MCTIIDLDLVWHCKSKWSLVLHQKILWPIKFHPRDFLFVQALKTNLKLLLQQMVEKARKSKSYNIIILCWSILYYAVIHLPLQSINVWWGNSRWGWYICIWHHLLAFFYSWSLSKCSPLGGTSGWKTIPWCNTFHMYFLQCHILFIQGTVTYHLPNTDLTWSSVFRHIESNKDYLGIVDYSVSQTTLEQVKMVKINNPFCPSCITYNSG